jgi:hypothetical protein
MRPKIAVITTVLLLMACGTAPVMAQGGPASPAPSQAVSAKPAPAPASAASQPASVSVARATAPGWAGYRSVRPGASQPTAKTAPLRSGWVGYAPSAAWSGYRTVPARSGSSPGPATARPVNNMDRSRVAGPNPYHGTQPRSYHEYGSGRRIPVAKPWLPGSP